MFVFHAYHDPTEHDGLLGGGPVVEKIPVNTCLLSGILFLLAILATVEIIFAAVNDHFDSVKFGYLY